MPVHSMLPVREKRPTHAQNRLNPGPSIPQIVHQVLASSGNALSATDQETLGTRLGHDFSGVRIHSDATAAASAESVHAAAYAFGRHIVFGRGQYQPGSSDGK